MFYGTKSLQTFGSYQTDDWLRQEGAPPFWLWLSRSDSQEKFIDELAQTGPTFQHEVEKDMYYQTQWIGKRRLDVLVYQQVLVELKAVG